MATLTTIAIVLSGLVPAQDVVDGDTFWLEGERVRLWGIQAQERGMPEYDLARVALADLLSKGQVSCTWTVRDGNGRPVAKCEMAGNDIGASMIKINLAVPHCTYARDYYNEVAISAGQHPCPPKYR